LMSTVTISVSSPDTYSERSYDVSLTVGALKQKLEFVTGIPVASQHLEFYSDKDETSPSLSLDSDQSLGSCGVTSGMHLKVLDMNPAGNLTGQFTDTSRVEKFEISKENYESRSNTIKAFKERNKLGRFSERRQESPHSMSTGHISIGDRVRVESEADLDKRGTVRFIGTTDFGKPKGADWVGIEYDEPVGRNDGSVNGERYFFCAMNHGAFVRPDRVRVGDFPPLTDLEEM